MDQATPEAKTASKPTAAPETPVVEKGTPSRRLQEALDRARTQEGGILDRSDESYQPVTEAAPEKGIFTIVGGYVDDDGTLHNEVELDAMGGDEEDLLGNDSVPFLRRMDSIMAGCCKRIGTITDPAGIHKAIRELPSGSKTHLFVCLRIASHYKTEKDVYEMEVRCPDNIRCGKPGFYKISLLDLELYQPEDPTQRIHEVDLPYAGFKAKWKTLTGKEDTVLTLLTEASEAEQLSFSILVRLVELDGENVELAPTECLTSDGKKVKLNKNAQALLRRVKAMKTGDRETLRADFMDKEASVETEVDVTCSHCNLDFIARLNVAQEAFFFPQVTSRRSKRRRSI
jgi:hypothetical protein